MREFVVVDTETTGLDPKSDRVVEIAAIRYRDGVETDVFCTLINPGRPIPHRATVVHGIRDFDVKDAPRYQDIRADVMTFVDASPIIAHNAAFDRRFLPDFERHPWLCTMRFARRIWPEAPRYGNAELYAWLKLHPPSSQLHRALVDARITASVFQAGLEKLRQSGNDIDLNAIRTFMEKPEKIVTMPFGKHRGSALSDMPLDYLQWASENLRDDSALHTALKKEYSRRKIKTKAR